MNDNIKKLVSKSHWLLLNDLRKQLELVVRADEVYMADPAIESIIKAIDEVSGGKVIKKPEWPID